jgi:uncharacterized membrane protein
MSNRWSTGRIEAFSDGVFAIAITLLVLEISVPEAAFEDLWHGIADQWPSYLAYVTSFLTIGTIWLMHHGIFRRLAQADGFVTRMNLLLLMLVSFLPFPTKLLAEAIDNADSERAAVIFYGLILLSISLMLTALWRYIATHRDLLKAGVSDDEVAAITERTGPNVAFYGIVILFAIFVPQIAAFCYLLIAVIAMFRARGDFTQSSEAQTDQQ